MQERYDSETAKHYAAYRPPLHALILEKLLDSKESFKLGIDIGCGTGYSAIALARYCDVVHGVDVSQEMLDRAAPHPKVEYRVGKVDPLSEKSNNFYDVVSFAGSLVYTKSNALRDNLKLVCCEDATILVYDFDVLLDDLLGLVGLSLPSDFSDYNHDIGMEDWKEFKSVKVIQERVSLSVNSDQMAHLILSDSSRYDLLSNKLGGDHLFECLVERLEKEDELELRADIWGKRYRLTQLTDTV